MKLVRSTSAPKLNQPKLYSFALLFALCIVVATVALLFFLDRVLEFVSLHGAGGEVAVGVVMMTATAGVFSLPYLLRMQVSVAMRLVSCMAMFVVVLGWLLAAWWVRLYVVVPYAHLGLVGAYLSLVLAVQSVWVIGLDIPLLKKRR